MNRNDISITYRQYAGEIDLPAIMQLVESELSEPYVVYTYRYFLHQWPHLSFLAFDSTSSSPVGAIVCKQSRHRNGKDRGYIGMLSVQKKWRKRGIARTLVNLSVRAMCEKAADEVILETEFDNSAALGLYEALGFIREKRLFRFYMNGKDAFRLVLDLEHLKRDDRKADRLPPGCNSEDLRPERGEWMHLPLTS
ncbi:acyl-CoA N-acyltransferase [Ramaria rubella]|nr:acyl-CoA N-acyltransferase [Ramaria rubella]